jgi:hypothetical protein
MTPERFRLAPHERTSPLWLNLERHMQQALAELRAMNDTSVSPERTEHLRGRIAQLKALLALADEPKPPPT